MAQSPVFPPMGIVTWRVDRCRYVSLRSPLRIEGDGGRGTEHLSGEERGPAQRHISSCFGAYLLSSGAFLVVVARE